MEKNLTEEQYSRLAFKDFMSISKWALSLIFRYEKKLTVAFVTTEVLLSVYYIADSYVMAKVLDVLVNIVAGSNTPISIIYPYMLVLIGLRFSQRFFGFVNSYSQRSISENVQSYLDKYLYEKLKSLGIQTLENSEVNNNISRASQDLHLIQDYFFRTIRMVAAGFGLVSTAGIVFSSAPLIFPLIALFSIPKYLNDSKYRTILWRYRYATTEERRIGYAPSYYLTDPTYLKEILISGAYNFMDSRYMKFVTAYVKKRMDLIKTWYLGSQTFQYLTDLGIYIAYLITFSRYLKAQISIGDVFFQISVIQRLSGDLSGFTSSLNTLLESSIRIKDIYSVFMLSPTIPDGTVMMPKLLVGPKIDFNNVTFSYPSSQSPVLKNININIRPGEKIAIVGHNGAGKTTLIKLLSRIYPVKSGEIFINDQNILSLNSDSLYQNMGVLFQDFNIYQTMSLRDNVIIGNSDDQNNEEAFVQALEKADALGFVNDFPQKYDQILGEKFTGGVRPSSGQWQKIAIARFFFRNAPLVIFDEPTAAIDAVSEYNIFNKIYKFFENKTVIIISHRFSTVRNADRIIVIEKGEIIEEGTHDNLIRQDGYYSKSFKLQAEGYSIAP